MFGDVDAEVSLDYWSLIDSNLSATDSAAAGKADNHASIGHSADDVRAVSEYKPSSANGGTAEQFPVDDVLPEYNPTRSLERAWNAIPDDKPTLFWETGFWSQLFDNSGGADLSVLQRDLKRPRVVGEPEPDAPVPKQPMRSSAENHEDFHDVVRDITIMDWREEREAKWETAIRRWRVSILSWNPHVRITQILAAKDNFKDQAQILVDVSPMTLLKRCNSLRRLINYMSLVHAKFPCTEMQLY